MNLRHAAAFALVGWCLMIPPDSVTAPHYADTKAPLARWISGCDYDTLKSCEETLAELQNNEKDPEMLYASSKCIASDDPRLNEK